MKQTKLIILFTAIATFSFGQTLQQGVYSTVILGIDSFPGHPWANGCWDYEYKFANNCLPYVTGMNLCLKIDTIKGASDSIQIWRWPDLVSIYLKTNDTVPLTNNINDIYFYYLDYDTLYTSLIAYGTPQIAGENYFCNYSKSLQVSVDGCAFLFAWVTGGNGPLDTIKNCIVLNPTGISETEQSNFEIYPNPLSDKLNVTFPNNEVSEIILYDIAARITIQMKFTNSVSLNTEQLAKGLYFYEVRNDGGSYKKGKVVKD